MDMNDVILSLGGVTRIDAFLPLDASDAEIEAHLQNNCHGTIPTLAQVKAQKPVYQALVAKAQHNNGILRQIAAIEETITPRRLREGIIGPGNGWLNQREQEIAALRAQLQA